MKYAIYVLFVLSCILTVKIYAVDVFDYWDNNREQLIENRITVFSGYVYAVGRAKKIASDNMAYEMAETNALEQLIDLKKNDVDFSKSPVKLSKKLQDAVWKNWHNSLGINYTVKQQISLEKFRKGNIFYYAAAYKLNNVIFTDPIPVSWSRIYHDFKNNPDKRNELLFFEIIPENELAALKDAVENNIAKQYGKNFSLMFMGKDVPAVPQKKYDIAKSASEKYNSETAFKILVIAANTLPYDKKICTLLAEKFDAMQMPRCAGIMRKCAGQNEKLLIEPEKIAAPAQENVIQTENKTFYSPVKKFHRQPEATDTARKTVRKAEVNSAADTDKKPDKTSTVDLIKLL